MSDELKPCPFCGGKAVLDDEYDGDRFWYYVRCAGDLHCMTTKSYITVQEAADIWNTRPIEDDLREKLVASVELTQIREEQIKEELAENAQLHQSYGEACALVAQMHAAAVGEVTGPKLGVVEDVLEVKRQLDHGRQIMAELLRIIDASISGEYPLHHHTCKEGFGFGECTCGLYGVMDAVRKIVAASEKGSSNG